jgi:hypothetical protein
MPVKGWKSTSIPEELYDEVNRHVKLLKAKHPPPPPKSITAYITIAVKEKMERDMEALK